MRSRYMTTRLGRGDVLGLPYLRCIYYLAILLDYRFLASAGVLLVCRDIGCPSAVTTYTVRQTLNEYRINLYNVLIFRTELINLTTREDEVICRAIVPRTLFTYFSVIGGSVSTEDFPGIHVSQQGGVTGRDACGALGLP